MRERERKRERERERERDKLREEYLLKGRESREQGREMYIREMSGIGDIYRGTEATEILLCSTK